VVKPWNASERSRLEPSPWPRKVTIQKLAQTSNDPTLATAEPMPRLLRPISTDSLQIPPTQSLPTSPHLSLKDLTEVAACR
jgi:hypothetical protein